MANEPIVDHEEVVRDPEKGFNNAFVIMANLDVFDTEKKGLTSDKRTLLGKVKKSARKNLYKIIIAGLPRRENFIDHKSRIRLAILKNKKDDFKVWSKIQKAHFLKNKNARSDGRKAIIQTDFNGDKTAFIKFQKKTSNYMQKRFKRLESNLYDEPKPRKPRVSKSRKRRNPNTANSEEQKDSTKTKKDEKDSTKTKKDEKDSSKTKKDKKDSTKTKKDEKDSSKTKKDEKDSSKTKKDEKDSTKTKKDEKDSSKTKKDEKDSTKTKKDEEGEGEVEWVNSSIAHTVAGSSSGRGNDMTAKTNTPRLLRVRSAIENAVKNKRMRKHG
jgi:hypothetical protein